MRSLSALLVAALIVAGCECSGGRPPIIDRDGGQRADASEDGGATDAGDGGSTDSGSNDAGGPDGGSPDGGGGDAGEIPPARYCEGILNAWCDHLLSCGALDPAQRLDCPDIFGWTCTAPQVVAAVDGGRVSYDGFATGRCVRDIALESCSETTPLPPSCNLIFQASTPIGGPCSRQWSGTCTSGYCNGTDCSATCTAWLPLDAGCTGTFGDECGFDATCRNGHCEARRDAGQSCAANDPCKAGLCNPDRGVCVEFGTAPRDAGCVSPAECEAALACVDGFCQPPRGIAEPCRIFGGTQCDADFTCRSFDGGLNGICWPRADAGEDCFGVPEDCFDGLVCSSPSLFAPGSCLRFEGEDAGCDRTVQNCRFGLRCDEASRCARLPRVGQSCTQDPLNFRGPDCASGFCASTDAGLRCAAPKDAGESCSRPWDCGSTYCTGGSCAELCL